MVKSMGLDVLQAWITLSGGTAYVTGRALSGWLEEREHAWPSLPWARVVDHQKHVGNAEILLGCPVAPESPTGQRPSGKHSAVFIEFHCIWILLQVLAKHCDDVVMGGSCPWTQDHNAIMDYVLPSLAQSTGLDASALREDMDVYDVAMDVCVLVAGHLAVDLDVELLRLDLSRLMPWGAPPMRALAHVNVWSTMLVPYLGAVMLRRLQVKCLEAFGAPRQDASSELAYAR